jgi:hypothetical protein
MRLVIVTLSVCALSAGCSGLNSPTAPSGGSSAIPGLSQTQARSGTDLPFRGSFTFSGGGAVNCPPTCPPTTLQVTNTHVGEATQMGRFTATSVDLVDLATAAGTGTFNFTAANGDQLFTETSGGEDSFVPPNVSHITLVARIVGGTGRFAQASGTFTLQSTTTIDFSTNTGTGHGSFEGQISLNN